MLVANSLTTVARACSYLNITVPTSGSIAEAVFQTLINSITSFVEKYTGQRFKKTTYTQELYSTERGQTLNLKHYPIISSESLTLERRNSQLNEDEWENIGSEYYSVDYANGIIRAMGGIYFYRGVNLYRVTYTAGYDYDNTTIFLGDTEAGEIEIACWLILQDVYKNKGNNANVKSERIGDYAVSYGDAKVTMFSNPQAKEILEPYADLVGEGILTPLQSI